MFFLFSLQRFGFIIIVYILKHRQPTLFSLELRPFCHHSADIISFWWRKRVSDQKSPKLSGCKLETYVTV